ncbi:hypothetical protein BVY03_04920 [bacterium K02(2017)]|nr:hypothetical protein BVY03_04920 [bacterium K02(2017)]
MLAAKTENELSFVDRHQEGKDCLQHLSDVNKVQEVLKLKGVGLSFSYQSRPAKVVSLLNKPFSLLRTHQKEYFEVAISLNNLKPSLKLTGISTQKNNSSASSILKDQQVIYHLSLQGHDVIAQANLKISQKNKTAHHNQTEQQYSFQFKALGNAERYFLELSQDKLIAELNSAVFSKL